MSLLLLHASFADDERYRLDAEPDSQRRGHDVQGVYKGSRLLALVREFDPDVVLLDIALPEKNGYELAEEIRKRPRGQRVLLIGISGQRGPPNVVHHPLSVKVF